MDFQSLAAARYSVRAFADTSVPEELLRRVLEAGRLAPTAKNLQSQRVYVLKSPEALATLASVKHCYNAPLVLMVCGDTSVACDRPIVDHNMAEMDASIVATHMMLAATECGLGSCWMCAFDPAKLAAAFALPEHITPFLLLPLGYPAENGTPSPRHTQREPLETTVVTL